MSTDRDPSSIRLPDDVAQRLLARATELDERNGRTSIDQLRRAATEAGISTTAFDSALAELARGELGTSDAPRTGITATGSWVTNPMRRGLIVAAAVVSLLVLAVGAVRVATTDDAPAAMELDAIEVEAAPPPPAAVDPALAPPAPTPAPPPAPTPPPARQP